MILFADVNVPPRLASIIKLLDSPVEIELRLHRDFFEPNLPDEEWILRLGEWNPKPFVLAYDGRILRNPIQIAALRESDLTFMYLRGWADQRFNVQVTKLAEHWERIIATLSKTSRPSIYSINVRGKIEELGATSQYKAR